MKAVALRDNGQDLTHVEAAEKRLRPSPNRGRSSTSRGRRHAPGGGGAPSPPSKRGSEASAASGATPAQRPPGACVAVPVALPEGTTGIDHGIHTVSFAYRGINADELNSVFADPGLDPVTGSRFSITHWSAARRQVVDPLTGASLTLRRDPQGRTLLMHESRLSPLLEGDRTVERLASPAYLREGEMRARETVARLGYVIPDDIVATVSRCDLASDASFTDHLTSQALLRALATLELPRWKRVTIAARGSSMLETIYWQTGEGIQLRCYDKTVEQSQSRKRDVGNEKIGGSAGTVIIRLERQIRRRRSAQLTPVAFAAQDLGSIYAGPLAKANFTPQPRDLLNTISILKSKVGEPVLPHGRVLTETLAERLTGTCAWASVASDRAWSNKRTAARRRRELQELGLVEAASGRVDVLEILSALTAPWHCGEGVGGLQRV